MENNDNISDALIRVHDFVIIAVYHLEEGLLDERFFCEVELSVDKGVDLADSGIIEGDLIEIAQK